MIFQVREPAENNARHVSFFSGPEVLLVMDVVCVHQNIREITYAYRINRETEYVQCYVHWYRVIYGLKQ